METLSKNKLSQLASYRQQKRCDEENLFVIEGPKLCLEALLSNIKIRTICATAEFWDNQTSPLRGLHDAACYEASQPQLERLSNLRTPNKIWMLAERPLFGKAIPSQADIIIALDNLQDPGNLGTILRTADWFGIRHLVCSTDTVSCFNPKVVQASMGAIFRTHVNYVNLAEFLKSQHERTVYGAMLGGESIYTCTVRKPAIIVIGNEGSGISPAVASAIHRSITIPNLGHTAESLNAAMAAAIICYEFSR